MRKPRVGDRVTIIRKNYHHYNIKGAGVISRIRWFSIWRREYIIKFADRLYGSIGYFRKEFEIVSCPNSGIVIKEEYV